MPGITKKKKIPVRMSPYLGQIQHVVVNERHLYISVITEQCWHLATPPGPSVQTGPVGPGPLLAGTHLPSTTDLEEGVLFTGAQVGEDARETC